jgi:hypothetical protein
MNVTSGSSRSDDDFLSFCTLQPGSKPIEGQPEPGLYRAKRYPSRIGNLAMGEALIEGLSDQIQLLGGQIGHGQPHLTFLLYGVQMGVWSRLC